MFSASKQSKSEMAVSFFCRYVLQLGIQNSVIIIFRNCLMTKKT